MGGLPDLLFVIDSNKESIAVAEARVLNIPVIAVVDSNSDPKDITFPIPGNDDASRAINLYCDLMVAAVLDGIQAEMAASGTDIGASEAVPEPSLSRRQRRPKRSRLPLPRPPLPKPRTTGPRPTMPGRRFRPKPPKSPRPRKPKASRRRRRPQAEIFQTEARQTDESGDGGAGQATSREDRRRHDGLQEGAVGERRRYRGGDRLAAQEGPCGGREEGGPRRVRGAGRRQGREHPRGTGRGQLRDRLRGAQRRLSGAGAQDRRSGAGSER